MLIYLHLFLAETLPPVSPSAGVVCLTEDTGVLRRAGAMGLPVSGELAGMGQIVARCWLQLCEAITCHCQCSNNALLPQSGICLPKAWVAVYCLCERMQVSQICKQCHWRIQLATRSSIHSISSRLAYQAPSLPMVSLSRLVTPLCCSLDFKATWPACPICSAETCSKPQMGYPFEQATRHQLAIFCHAPIPAVVCMWLCSLCATQAAWPS